MSNPLEYARTYLTWGLDDLARKELLSIKPESPDYVSAWVALSKISDPCDLSHQSRLADEGRALISKHGPLEALILETAENLHYAGRSGESFDLIKLNGGRLNWNAVTHYGMATYAARTGRWPQAAWHLLESLKLKMDRHTFFDLDLEPLFEFGATGSLDEETAIALAHPQFVTAFRSFAGCCWEVDTVMERILPSQIRPLLVRNPATGFLSMPPKAGAGERKTYLGWQRVIGERIENLAQRAFANARRLVLERQLAWALQAARRGDYFSARWHTIFALAEEPNLLTEFESALRSYPLTRLFTDLRQVLKQSRSFCRDFYLVAGMAWSQDAVDHGLSEQVIMAGSGTGFAMLRQSNAAEENGDVRESLGWSLELIKHWPNEPSGWFKAALRLAQSERWKEAAWVLRGAPKSCFHLRNFRPLLREVANKRVTDVGTGATDPFYGQPGIGGIIKRKPCFSPRSRQWLGQQIRLAEDLVEK